jgi:hypothetical protein
MGIAMVGRYGRYWVKYKFILDPFSWIKVSLLIKSIDLNLTKIIGKGNC